MECAQILSSSPSSDPAASVATASSTATPFSATSCPSATVAAAASTSTASRASAAFASTHFTACVQNCCSSPMCVVADEIEEDGSNDASGADGAKRQRVGDASGGASGFEDGGGVRNGDELSADDLTQLAACDDVGLDLTEKESALLDVLRLLRLAWPQHQQQQARRQRRARRHGWLASLQIRAAISVQRRPAAAAARQQQRAPLRAVVRQQAQQRWLGSRWW